MNVRILAFLTLAACGTGQTVDSHDHPGSTTGDGATGAVVGDSGGEASAPSADAAQPAPGTLILDLDAGAVWTPKLHACRQSPTGFTQYEPPPAGPSLTPCPGAGLSGVQIASLEGGPIAPGATAILSVFVTNSGAQIGYPCLGIYSENPDVSFASGGPELYAIVSNVTFSTEVTFGPSIVPGTHVRFAAWVGGSGGPSPDGSATECQSGLLEWEVVL